jgi:plasmid maintenance system antidote protein VapI
MIKIEETMGILEDIFKHPDTKTAKRVDNRILVAMKINAKLKEKTMSVEEFSKLVKRDRATVEDWLSGDRNISLDTLTDIEEILGIDIINKTH